MDAVVLAVLLLTLVANALALRAARITRRRKHIAAIVVQDQVSSCLANASQLADHPTSIITGRHAAA